MNTWQIEGIAPTQPLTIGPKAKATETGFAGLLKNALAQVNHEQHQADTAIQKVVKGEMGISEGMMAVTEADMSLRLLLKVRSKVLDAYQQISRM
jgi:flagellar hook-basal body complex protein FliE